MNVLHQLRKERINSKLPIVKVVDKGEKFKMVGIALANGTELSDHKTSLASKLIVIEGSIEYKESNRNFTLHHFDDVEIPENEIHALVAKEDSLCLLIQKN